MTQRARSTAAIGGLLLACLATPALAAVKVDPNKAYAVQRPPGFGTKDDFETYAKQAQNAGVVLAVIRAPKSTKDHAALRRLIDAPGLKNMARLFLYDDENPAAFRALNEKAKHKPEVPSLSFYEPRGNLIAYIRGNHAADEVAARSRAAEAIGAWYKASKSEIKKIEDGIKAGRLGSALRAVKDFESEDQQIDATVRKAIGGQPMIEERGGKKKEEQEKPEVGAAVTGRASFFFGELPEQWRTKINEAAAAELKAIQALPRDTGPAAATVLARAKKLQLEVKGLDVAGDVESFVKDLTLDARSKALEDKAERNAKAAEKRNKDNPDATDDDKPAKKKSKLDDDE